MTDDREGSLLGDELIASLDEGIAILEGRQAPSRFHPAPTRLDVRAIRTGLGLSQVQFARRFGFSPSALRDWEGGRRQPEAAVRVLLLIIAKRPDVVEEVLAGAAPEAA